MSMTRDWKDIFWIIFVLIVAGEIGLTCLVGLASGFNVL